MNARAKNVLIVGCCIVAIAGSALLLYRQYRTPAYSLALHERVGEVMAEQTAKAVGRKGRILLITMPIRSEPQLAAQLAAFRRKLRALGDFEIKDHELDTKGQPKYGVGNGLSGRRLARAVKNHPEVDAIVSFAGAPTLSQGQISALKNMPKFIVETRSPDHLPVLFEKHLIWAAVASRFTFPAPGPLRPRSPQEWFDKRYQVVTAEHADIILK